MWQSFSGLLPAAENALKQRSRVVYCHNAIKNAVICSLFTLVLSVDLSYFKAFSFFIPDLSIFFTIAELCLLCITSLSCVLYLFYYAMYTFLLEPVCLTDLQAKLLGFSQAEVSSSPTPNVDCSDEKNDDFFFPHASLLSGSPQPMFNASSLSSNLPCSIGRLLGGESLHSSSVHGSSLHSLNNSSLHSFNNSSLNHPKFESLASFSKDKSSFGTPRSVFSFSKSPESSPFNTPLHSRVSPNSSRNSSLWDFQPMKSYIEEISDRIDQDKQNSGCYLSARNDERPLSDSLPPLPVGTYQLGLRPDPVSRSTQSRNSSSPATFLPGEAWSRFGVEKKALSAMILNLRKWICLTVLRPVAKEIKLILRAYSKLRDQTSFSDTSMAELKQLSINRESQFPTLKILLPFLDMMAPLNYLVGRIIDLSRGGCISDFVWNGGGSYLGAAWSDKLPTDTAIVYHILCTYLDLRLPGLNELGQSTDKSFLSTWKSLRTAAAEPFSSQHCVSRPDTPDKGRKDQLLLYLSSFVPPHFEVISGEDSYDIPPGRSNFFEAFLLFLYFIQTQKGGKIGRISTGNSGLNISWVLGEMK